MLKWSLPDNSHVCLVSESGDNESPDRDHVSRDMAVSVSTDHTVSLIRTSHVAPVKKIYLFLGHRVVRIQQTDDDAINR